MSPCGEERWELGMITAPLDHKKGDMATCVTQLLFFTEAYGSAPLDLCSVLSGNRNQQQKRTEPSRESNTQEGGNTKLPAPGYLRVIGYTIKPSSRGQLFDPAVDRRSLQKIDVRTGTRHFLHEECGSPCQCCDHYFSLSVLMCTRGFLQRGFLSSDHFFHEFFSPPVNTFNDMSLES